ncbi:hypothetical membrane associated protein [Streptococcus pyogenes]|nr:hypothetical membrane associated protein [Streptococcus pyogenes]
MTTMKELTINDMASISGGNAPGDAVIGGLGGLASGLKFCKCHIQYWQVDVL